jgi:hypothetical protein
MSRKLDDLSREFKPLAIELLARLTEAGIAVMIVDTLRTPAEHAENLANGTSKTARSRHLFGDAIDVCPFETWALHGPDKLQWNTKDPIWKQIGNVGEALGLRWGGRWADPHDPGHFELVRPAAAKFANHSDTGSEIPGGGAS